MTDQEKFMLKDLDDTKLLELFHLADSRDKKTIMNVLSRYERSIKPELKLVKC